MGSTNLANGDTITESWTDEVSQLGLVAVAQTGSTSQTASTLVDITDLSVTFTAKAARVYKITLNVNVQKSTAGIVALYLTDSVPGTQLVRSVSMVDGQIDVIQLVWTQTIPAGSTTRKARISCDVGTVTVVNSSVRNGILLVEDIGKA